MQIVIEIPDEEYNRMKDLKMFGNVTVWKNAICNGTPLPKDATNGDIINAIFPDALLTHEFDIDWWYTPYKRGEEDEVSD